MAIRRVTNFDQLNDALRELFQFADTLSTRNINLTKRRVINAHPSIDDYDYVVRKELHDLVGGGVAGRRKPTTTAKTYDKITFGIGIGRSIEVGSNATPPYIWTNVANGRPDIVAMAANTPPTVTDLIIDIKKNGTSIFLADEYTFPASTAARTVVHDSSSIFKSNLLFTRYDVFSLDVLQTGSGVAGGEIEIVVFCNLV